MEVDAELVIPDTGKSLAEGAISIWTTPYVAGFFQNIFAALAEHEGFSVHTPWEQLPSRVQRLLLGGVPGQVTVRSRSRHGREHTYRAKYEGALPYVSRRHAEADSDLSLIHIFLPLRSVPDLHRGEALPRLPLRRRR